MLDVMNVHLKIDFQKRFSKFSLYNTYQTITRQLLEFQETAPSINRESNLLLQFWKKKKNIRNILFIFSNLSTRQIYLQGSRYNQPPFR